MTLCGLPATRLVTRGRRPTLQDSSADAVTEKQQWAALMRELRGASSHLDAMGGTRSLLRTVWQMSNASLCEAASKVIALLMAAADREHRQNHRPESSAGWRRRFAECSAPGTTGKSAGLVLRRTILRASSAQTSPNQSRQVTEKLKIPLKQCGRSRP